MWKITNERQDASPLLGFLPIFSSMTTDIATFLSAEINLEFLVEFSYPNDHVATKDREHCLVGDSSSCCCSHSRNCE